MPATPRVPDFAEDLAGRIDDAAQMHGLRDALSRLRSDEREVLALCVWSGLDYAAAALALGVPVGTVRSRLSRARKKLRRPAVTAAEGRAERREPRTGCEQLGGGRDHAARLEQE